MKTLRIALMAATIFGLSVVSYLVATFYLNFNVMPPGPFSTEIRSPAELQAYFMVRTIVSTVNTGLSICLLIIYGGIYMRTRAKFTIGLIIFATTMLVYAITSNPLLHVLFMFRYGLGLYAAIPELFTTVAMVVLLYLSLK